MAQVIAAETCRFCGSYNIVVNRDGEAVCRNCATVQGPLYYVPPLRALPLHASGRPRFNGDARDVAPGVPLPRSRDWVAAYIRRAVEGLGLPAHVLHTSLALLDRLDNRAIQGKRPHSVAGALVVLAAEKTGTPVKRVELAQALSVNDVTLRINVKRLRRWLE